MLIFIIIAILVIYFAFNLIAKDKKGSPFSKSNDSVTQVEKLPYNRKKYLLSKAEYNFYKVLENAIDLNKYYICPKVRVADIIYVTSNPNRQRYFNKIQSKHIDFLLCDKEYLTPKIAIELDDKSHNKSNRVKRDEFLDNAFDDAGVKLLRFRASYSYSPNYINEKISENFATIK
ncbi:DUF2726 domain-containing protein [Sporosalibacterium faouarense]|uniref:DUF2726 domain-containing protein n=1 Tax=Sporosalibacterium faouarense TaxID=516123 RepID=UPI00141CEF1D|nr:DUF2726 domain-containing protein [Sporosalibacterium faouarense]MTI46678.1 DUF2726 domain-containing protein [Bacillota bacterium]